jgi:hypothetical protein
MFWIELERKVIFCKHYNCLLHMSSRFNTRKRPCTFMHVLITCPTELQGLRAKRHSFNPQLAFRFNDGI